MPKDRHARVLRVARHKRVRRRVVGTVERPRLSVFRSLKNIYAQIIDDGQQHTLVSASSLDKELQEDGTKRSKMEWSQLVGSLIARKATKQGITQVVFDRGGYNYHGRVKTLAEAARKEGLLF